MKRTYETNASRSAKLPQADPRASALIHVATGQRRSVIAQSCLSNSKLYDYSHCVLLVIVDAFTGR